MSKKQFLELLEETKAKMEKSDIILPKKDLPLTPKSQWVEIFNHLTLALFFILYGVITSGIIIKYFTSWFINPIFNLELDFNNLEGGAMYFFIAFLIGRLYNKEKGEYTIFDGLVAPWIILVIGYFLSV